MMVRRSGSGGSTLDCLGTRLVPAHFWLPLVYTPNFHHLFALFLAVSIRLHSERGVLEWDDLSLNKTR